VYILVLALTIAIDYTAALLIERSEGRKRKGVPGGQHRFHLHGPFCLQVLQLLQRQPAQVARFFPLELPH